MPNSITMKTIDDQTQLTTYTIPDMCFGIMEQGRITFHRVKVLLTVESDDYKIRGILSPVDWFAKMLNDKLFVPVSEPVGDLEQFVDCMTIEEPNVDYIMLTMLRMLRKIDPDTNIKTIQYEI